MGFWDWLGGTGVDVTGIISGGGLLTLTTLTLTDRLVTKGRLLRDLAAADKAHADLTQAADRAHAAELANLETYHNALLAERDRRYAELEQSRDYYRDAHDTQRDRADKVTEQLAESLELSRAAVHALTALDEATRT